MHVPLPLHAPDQPVNRDSVPEAMLGVAVSVTVVPSGYDDEHALPQLTPPSAEETEPEPVPASDAVSG